MRRIILDQATKTVVCLKRQEPAPKPAPVVLSQPTKQHAYKPSTKRDKFLFSRFVVKYGYEPDVSAFIDFRYSHTQAVHSLSSAFSLLFRNRFEIEYRRHLACNGTECRIDVTHTADSFPKAIDEVVAWFADKDNNLELEFEKQACLVLDHVVDESGAKATVSDLACLVAAAACHRIWPLPDVLDKVAKRVHAVENENWSTNHVYGQPGCWGHDPAEGWGHAVPAFFWKKESEADLKKKMQEAATLLTTFQAKEIFSKPLSLDYIKSAFLLDSLPPSG